MGDFCGKPDNILSAFIRLGLAHAGHQREDLVPTLLPFVADDDTSMEIAALSALSLGFIFVGSCHGEIASAILQTMMERPETQLSEKWGRFMALGLGLLYLGTSHCKFLT
jgi:26S proteasome regulatory subunit N1